MLIHFKRFIFVTFSLIITTACFAQTPTETLSVSGLKDSVKIQRDGRSIPYIDAKNDADLYFAQGFITAQDRLWQMDLYRRVASGRTAEIFGNTVLEEDKRWRRFGFDKIVAESYKNLDAEFKAALDNYALGVNAYIATLNKDSMPAEFKILQYQPEVWKATDSLIIGKILTDALSTTWWADAARAKFKDVPNDVQNILFNQKTPFDVLVVGKDFEEKPKAKGKTASLNLDENFFDFAKNAEQIRKQSLERIGFYEPFNAASNNFVVSGKRTLDGKPILANDPHLRASAPSIWYLVNLSSPGNRVAGVTLPGVPGVVLGHNEFIAWGATNLGPDVQDLYIEEFNDKKENKTANGFQPSKIRTEEIKVRKSPFGTETENVSMEVIETDDGVIIQDNGAKKVALKWTAFDSKNNELEAFLLLNRAKNWDEYKAALKNYGGATQNFIYADVKGNIGFHNAGAIPIRDSGDGSVPYDGTKAAGKWTRYIPFDELPESYNPPSGFIVTANQRLAGDSYKYYLGNLWADPYRARRIYQLLEANKKVTIQDAMDIQHDIYNISYANFAREVVKMEAASDESLKILRGWDGKMSADSQAALLVNFFRRAIYSRIWNAKLGEDLTKQYQPGNFNAVLDNIIVNQPADWLPKEFKSYKDLFIAADKDARQQLAKDFGADEAKWNWGSYWKISFPHPLAAAPIVGGIFVVESVPGSGYSLTPNVGQSVSMRLVTMPGDWDKTRHGIALGESGDPKSAFYKDQFESWLSGNTPVFPFSKSVVEKNTVKTIVMKP